MLNYKISGMQKLPWLGSSYMTLIGLSNLNSLIFKVKIASKNNSSIRLHTYTYMALILNYYPKNNKKNCSEKINEINMMKEQAVHFNNNSWQNPWEFWGTQYIFATTTYKKFWGVILWKNSCSCLSVTRTSLLYCNEWVSRD